MLLPGGSQRLSKLSGGYLTVEFSYPKEPIQLYADAVDLVLTEDGGGDADGRGFPARLWFGHGPHRARPPRILLPVLGASSALSLLPVQAPIKFEFATTSTPPMRSA
jgi:hypothetical protein